jgi:phosphatidylglycerophosphatase A
VNKWLVTFFGAGLLPKAPGTAGSLAACIVLAVVWHVLTPAQWVWALPVMCLIMCAIAVRVAPWAIAHYGRKDPQAFVLDEVAGVCVSAMFVPLSAVWHWVFVFAAFRVFDVTKPPPARQLEKLPAGWGILLDDLAAGVYANIVCQLILRWLVGG